MTGELICEIISGVATVVAVLASVLIYIHGLNREKRNDTIKSLSDIRMKYPNSKQLSEEQKKQYLTELAFFSTGVNAKVYNIKIVKRMSGRRLIRQYDDWAKDYIISKEANNVKPYLEYEKMILKLKKYYEKK